MASRALPSLLPGLTAVLLLLLAPGVLADTADAPEAEDPAGDADLDGLDLTAIWVDADDASVTFHASVAAWPEPVTTVNCAAEQCAGAGFTARILFTVLDPTGKPAPTVEGYNRSYVLFRWGPGDANLRSLVGTYDDAGTPTPIGPANATVDGSTVSLQVPRDSAALALPMGATPGKYRITGLWAYTAPLGCAPDAGQGAAGAPAGCFTLNQPTPGGFVSEWDRAPDAGFGTDYVFPEAVAVAAAAPAAPAEAVPATAQTVTATQTETATETVTETFTSTPLPLKVEAKGAPAPAAALLLAGLAALAVVRRGFALGPRSH